MVKNKSKVNKKSKKAVGKAKKNVKLIKVKKNKSQPKVQKVVKVDPEITSEESDFEQPEMKAVQSINKAEETDSSDSVPAILKNVADTDSEDQDVEDQQSIDEKEELEEEYDDESKPPQKNSSSKKIHPIKTEAVRTSDSENPPCTRVFVANLARASTDQSVTSFFMSNGLPTTDIYVPKNNGVHKGFAFAELKDIQSATRAVGLSGHQLDGAEISISFAKPRRGEQEKSYSSNESGDSNTLFIKNLGPGTTREILQGHFKNFKEIRLMTDDDGNCRGHAYVEYSSSADAISAKEKMVGYQIEGSQIYIDFAKPRVSNPRGGSSFRGRGNTFGHFADEEIHLVEEGVASIVIAEAVAAVAAAFIEEDETFHEEEVVLAVVEAVSDPLEAKSNLMMTIS
ncbi:hypothetical protein MXB_5448 [Myxobolus squamalis]|nr:hypothetical protein MXB_5448 [Myxobolus squamalis]